MQYLTSSTASAAVSGRTEFQVQRIQEIAQREGFEHFCGDPGCDEPYRGPFMCLWYERGTLHYERIGQQRVLRSSAGATGEP